MKAMKVEQIMTPNPACCLGDDFVQVAASIMRRLDVGIVPVVDTLGPQGKLVGVITDRDLCLGVIAEARDPNITRVSELMSKHPETVKPNDTMEHVLGHMRHAQIRRIPVVNDEFAILGMVSLSDVVRDRATPEGEVCKTLAAISAPMHRKIARAA